MRLRALGEQEGHVVDPKAVKWFLELDKLVWRFQGVHNNPGV